MSQPEVSETSNAAVTSTEPVTSTQPAASKARTPDQIEAEIVATRENLAASIDAINEKVSPANVAGRLQAKVMGVVQREDGSPDPVRIGAAVAVAVVLVLYVVRRRRL